MAKATKQSESRTDDPKVEGADERRVISLVESNLAPPVDAAVAARVARDTAPFPIVKSDEDADEGE